MSKTAKWIIGIVVVAAIVYFVYKAYKKPSVALVKTGNEGMANTQHADATVYGQ